MRRFHNGMRKTRRGTLAAVILVVSLTPWLSGTGGVPASQVARAEFEASLARWQRDLASAPAERSGVQPLAVAAAIESLLDMDAVARAVLPDQWQRLTTRQQGLFREALTASFRMRTLDIMRSGTPDLTWRASDTRKDHVVLSYRVSGWGTAPGVLAVELAKNEAGSWRAQDLAWNDRRLVEEYRERSARVLRDYSFPALLAELQDAPFLVLEDFETGPVGGLPDGWSWRDTDNEKEKPYAVRQEEGNRYLEATDEGQSVILGKDISWDLQEYPYVSFRLRVKRVPPGGDERDDDAVDSAAGVYFTYRRLLGRIPESVKYVWSSTLPVGSAVRRDGVGRPWMVVAGSGTDGLGEWRTYVFDLRQAYRDTFRKNPPKMTVGVGILSDANSTRSQAYADYDDIRALRTVAQPVGSGVTRILRPIR